MSDKIQLAVGYVGVTRGGKRVEIVNCTGDTIYPWRGCTNETYTAGGRFSSNRKDARDIVGFLRNPVNYNDGSWHRWGGDAKCPVHKNTLVQVRFLNPTDEYGDMTALASEWWWKQPCDCPIIAFRVTKEYVEPRKPRDFWIATMNPMLQCDVKIKKPDDMYGYIHVREVIK